MKRLTFERIGIILFCATLIGSGALTVGNHAKSIAAKTLSGIKSGYASMKRLTFERIGIILFCATLIGSGALTVGNHAKSIAAKTLSGIKSGYASKGISGGIIGGISGLEAGVNENVFARTAYINLYGLSARLLNKHYIIETNATNSVVKDNNDFLQFISFPVDTAPYVEKISGIKKTLDELNTPLLYVQTPLKTIEDYTQMPEGIVDYANSNTDTFLTQLEEAGIDVLDLRQNVIQTPLKTIEDYTQMPEGIVDYANSNTDTFLTQLEEAGIDVLDLRQNVKEEGLELDKLFYRTDHHWTTQTALWAVGEVVDYLKQNLGMDLDPKHVYTNSEELDKLFYRTDHHWTTQTALWAVGEVVDYLKQNLGMDLDPKHVYTNSEFYGSAVYKKSFLGSQGRRVGKYYGGVDDYTLMLPKFDTNYTVTINKTNNSTVTEGTFEEAIVKRHLLDEKDIFTNRYAA